MSEQDQKTFEVVVLQGVCSSIMKMTRPSVEEFNKLIKLHGYELVRVEDLVDLD